MSKPKLVSNAKLFAKRGDDWSAKRPNPATVHIPSEAEKKAAAILNETVTVTTKKTRKMPEGRWTKRVVSVEETRVINKGPLYEADEAFRKAVALQAQESPDYDQFFCKKAEAKPEYVDPPGQPIEDSNQARARRILHTMHREMHHSHTVARQERVKVKAPETRKAEQRARDEIHYLYIHYDDGREKEPEYESKTVTVRGERVRHTGLMRAEQAFDFYRRRDHVDRVEIWSNKTGEMIKSWSRK